MGKLQTKVGKILQIDKGSLKRVLGISDLFAIGYGDLGSSIFYALGITAMFALGATPIALGLAGLLFVCTALSYAEMTSMFQETGGSASFARHAFNDLISFLAGWGLLLDYIVTIAISAFTIGPYLTSFVPLLSEAWFQIAFTVFLIFVLLVINIFGVSQSTRLSFFLMVFTLITEVGLIGIGIFCATHIKEVFTQLIIGKEGVSWSPSWHQFIKGVAMAMVAYTGIESIAQLGAETKRPARTLPRSIVLTTVILILMYLGLSFVALAVVTPEKLGSKYSQNPIEGIVHLLPFGQEIFIPWVCVLASVLLFVASNAGLIGASRLSFTMGEYYQLPRFFYSLHPKFRTPYASLIFFAITASIIVAISSAKMSFLADLYNFGAQIAFFSTHISLLALRVKRPDQKRPFKVPLNIRIKGYEIPIPAILGALGALAVWLLVVVTKPEGRYLGFMWMGLGLWMYFAYRKKANISATAKIELEKIKIPKFKPLEITNILLPVRNSTQMETVQIACELANLHKAKLTILHVIEVPFSLPLETEIPGRMEMAQVLLKSAEAITLEIGVDASFEVVRSRSLSDAVLELLETRGFDLLILGAMKSRERASQKGVGLLTEKILEKSPCRVWICGSDCANGSYKKGIVHPTLVDG